MRRALAFLLFLVLPALLSQAQPDAEISQDFVDAERERITRLFDALDLSHPGLEAVDTAWRAGHTRQAIDALLRYYREIRRRPPVEHIGRASRQMIASADDALQGVFTLQDVRATQARRPDGGIDWSDQGPRDDKEWAWFLNRHQFMRDLASAARTTRKPQYREALSAYLVDWVRANPYPDRLTFSAQWRALEVARRVLDVWTPLFYQSAAQLSPEARVMMLCSLVDHADALRNHASFWGGNHLLTEKTGLAMIAACWPEFRGADDWLAYALDVSQREIMAQTFPDGAYEELTNHYQRVVLVNVEQLLRVVRFAGLDVRSLDERAEQMWDYFVGVMRPNGTGPLNSASDLEGNRAFLNGNWLEYGRPDWLYMASNGRAGTPPAEPPSRYFPYAGHAVMRSGWDGNAQWAFFDIGPHGTAHQHNDRLHLSVTLGLVDVLVDAGRYNYVPGPWSDYYEGAAAHNTLLLDGRGPVPPPLEAPGTLDVQAVLRDEYDFFSGSNRYAADPSRGQGGQRHTRSVFYLRGLCWVVVDHVLSFGPHEITFPWHFHPDLEVNERDNGLVATGYGRTFLHLLPLNRGVDWELVRGREDPPMGWYSRDYNVQAPAVAALARVPVRKPFTIVWLLWPDVEGPPPATRVSEDGPRVQIEVDGPSGFSFTLDAEKGRLIEAIDKR